MKTILFQGDSITDAGRNRDYDPHRGSGYATIVSGKLGYEYPDEYNFINRGISGNRSVDLYARIKRDIINLKPDYLSILIGINDIWHELESQNGVSENRFSDIMDMLIYDVKKALPEVKIFMLGAFVTPGTATDEKLTEFVSGAKSRAEATKKLCEKHSLSFIDLQAEFDKVIKTSSYENWTCDGVHPTAAGHELIAREWIKVFEKIK